MSFGKPSISGIVRRMLWASLSIGGLVILPGCSGSTSQEELGEIHYHLPRIDGMETRYYLEPMMQSKAKPKSEDKTEQQSSAAAQLSELTGESVETTGETTTADPPPPAAETDTPKTVEQETGSPPEPADEPAPAPEKSTAPGMP
jgi:hypothetical protein